MPGGSTSGNSSGFSNPLGGNGMSPDNAMRILNPAGFGGQHGMDTSAAEAFFDPLGIDSGPSGLNLFGKRQNPNANTGPSTLPNLGIKSRFYDPNSFMARPGGGGMWNAMAAQLAGPMYNPQFAGAGTPPAKQAPMGMLNFLQGIGNNPALNKLAGTRRGF